MPSDTMPSLTGAIAAALGAMATVFVPVFFLVYSLALG